MLIEKLVKLTTPELETLQIVPDRGLNNTTVDVLASSFYEIHRPLTERVNLKSREYLQQNTIFWEIVMEPKMIAWYMSHPKQWGSFLKQKVETAWPKVTINKNPDPWANKVDLKQAIGARLTLKNHFFMSLKIRRNSPAPIPSILEVTRSMTDSDLAVVQMAITPAEEDWDYLAVKAYDKYKTGENPSRGAFGRDVIKQKIAKGAFQMGEGAADIMALCLGSKSKPDDVTTKIAELRQKQPLTPATMEKIKYPGFDVAIRILVQSENEHRRKTNLRSLTAAFRSLSADNEFTAYTPPDQAQFVTEVKDRKLPMNMGGRDLLSSMEVSKLIQLPTRTLQDDFKTIQQIERKETNIPKILLDPKGIPFAYQTYKGQTNIVYWPLNSKDELCRLRLVIGPMGCGKTDGYGVNFGTDVLRKGYSLFAFDVADGKLCTGVRDSLPADFPEDHIISIDCSLDDWPIPWNWSEVALRGGRKKRIANALACSLVDFMSKFADDAGDRTRRYLKAAAKAVFDDPKASLLEIVLMLCSQTFRAEKIKTLQEPRLAEMWRTYHNLENGAQRQIYEPVLARLDTILDDYYLANSLCQQQKIGTDGKPEINFRKWADGDTKGPYAVLIRVPKSKLQGATDALVTFLFFKLWLAILTRDGTAEEFLNPCFMIADEPHQFPSICAILSEVAVECRKYRFGPVLMFHNWEQIPERTRRDIKSGGPHITIYAGTAKEEIKSLAEEISPFNFEDIHGLKTHEAFNMVLAGKQYHRFLSTMIEPAIDQDKKKEWRYPYIDRAELTMKTHKKYGRPVDQVEADIFQREKMLFQQAKKPTAAKKKTTTKTTA